MMEGFGHMGFGWILWIVVIIFGIWFIINFINKNKTGNESSESALDVLKKRYANGEISSEQFEEMKKNLNK